MVSEKNEYDVEKFRQYITALKGNETMGGFASKCGISREHLSRLMNGNAKKRPSMETLRKIADATGEDYEKLLILCGYAASPAGARKQREFDERVQMNAKDMMDGLQSLTQGVRLYNSLGDFIETYNMLYSHESCKYVISKKDEYDGSLFSGAENYATIEVMFSGAEGSCWTFAVLYYSVTKGGKYLMQGVAMDGESLLEAEFLKPETMSKMGFTESVVRDMPYITYIRESPEQKLFKKIFGNKQDEYPFPETGIGMDVTVMPEGTAEFIARHESSLSEDERDFFKTKEFAANADPEEYFDGLEDNESCASGYKAVLAAIMRAETELPFTAFESNIDGAKDVDGRAKAGIFCPNTDSSNKSVMKASREYAKELGLSEYGEQLVYMVHYKGSTYKVEE